MDKSHIGSKVVIIISSYDTIKGTITAILSENRFEITDDYGNRSNWNEDLLLGIKWKGDV